MSASLAAWLTDWGDQGVILPAVATVAVVLLLIRRFRLAASWTVVAGAVLGIILVLKLIDGACGWTVPILRALDLVSPSGHAASATVVWGGLAALATAGRRSHTIGYGLATAVVVCLVVGTTRLTLGAHTLAEVVAGGLVGLCGSAVLAGLSGFGEAPALRRTPVLAATAGLLVMFATHGRHLQAEPTIHGPAVTLVRDRVPACLVPADVPRGRWPANRPT